MTRIWVEEERPTWDAHKERIIGGCQPGIFHLGGMRTLDVVPGEWWHVEEDGDIVGYGWMDVVWGAAEVLVAVDPKRRDQGLGAYILKQLEGEARKRGLSWMHNIVRRTHPAREATTRWLLSQGFERTPDDESLRRRVPPAS